MAGLKCPYCGKEIDDSYVHSHVSKQLAGLEELVFSWQFMFDSDSQMTSEERKLVPEDSLFVTLGDFSEELKKGIAREFQDFGVPLILDGRPAGSGVLVQIHDVYGILTAEHVVYNPIGAAFDNSRSSKQVLSVPLTRYEIETVTPAAWTDTVGIQVKYLSWYPASGKGRDYDEWGPDLAFIALPVSSEILSQLRKKKSFYNLTKDPPQRMERALQEDTFLAIVGCPRDWIKYEPGQQEGQLTGRIVLATFFSGMQRYESNKGGFDYIDLEGDRKHASLMPNSFKGVSGGALWRFWISWERPGELESLKMCDYVLAGVVFWENLENAERPWLRSHGPVSVYQRLTADFRAQPGGVG